MAAAGGSNIGLRKNNEDSYYINEACGLFAIADGMGGHEHGQLASRIAVEQFANLVQGRCLESFSLEEMRGLFTRANAAIYQQQEALHSGIMGTTLTAVIIDEDMMYVGHVGDSRLYWLHEGTLTQLTMDHSYYAELVRQGTEELHIENRQKNVLLKALGPEAQVEGQFLQQTLSPGDMLLLCTDGLYNYVEPEEMQRVMQQPVLQHGVRDLLDLALTRQASDNLTAILYRHEQIDDKG